MGYNMSEKQGDSFTKVVLKKAGRAKERLLQNFGKADRTTDELFELFENNFNKQQNSATRLQKELKNYVSCIRGMQAASKNLMDCLTDIYEPEWPGHEQLPLKAHSLELLWEELCLKLNDQVTIPLSTYLCQFSEIKAKIDKRGRKLVDYDGTRHALESVQNNPKRKDDLKLAKLREEMEGARRLYDVLNKELHEELPALYDSRIPFLISILQTLFACQSAFHGQLSRHTSQLNAIVDELAMEAQKGTFHINARLAAGMYSMQLSGPGSPGNNSIGSGLTSHPPGQQSPVSMQAHASQQQLHSGQMNKKPIGSYGQLSQQPGLDASTAIGMQATDTNRDGVRLPSDDASSGSLSNGRAAVHKNSVSSTDSSQDANRLSPDGERGRPVGSDALTNQNTKDVRAEPAGSEQQATSNQSNGLTTQTNLPESITTPTSTSNVPTPPNRVMNEIPVGATTTDLPSGVLYNVRTTYKYEAEDSDELSFEAGEIIHVIEYEDPEEQEEGWLMGYKASNGEKGLFPANFTRPI